MSVGDCGGRVLGYRSCKVGLTSSGRGDYLMALGLSGAILAVFSILVVWYFQRRSSWARWALVLYNVCDAKPTLMDHQVYQEH